MSKVRVTLVKSKIGRPNQQKLTLTSLGLNKLGSSVEHASSPEILGMINKVKHLVVSEEIK